MLGPVPADPYTIHPSGRFSLAAAARFIAAWPPAQGVTVADDGSVRLSFVLDSFAGHGGARVVEGDGGVLRVEPAGEASEDELRRQVARILSLDHDGAGLAEVIDRDPVVAAISRGADGLRPVLFHSPYEAAAWSVISARTQQRRAQRVRAELSRELGVVLEVGGVAMPAFPLPQRLAELDAFPGLTEEKVTRLRGLAAAALEGRLDPERLRAAEPATALLELQQIRGIGPFYAGLILVRSAGVTDVLPPGVEPRLRAAVGDAYSLGGPASAADFERITDGWRPFRTWIAVLMRSAAGG